MRDYLLDILIETGPFGYLFFFSVWEGYRE